MKKVKVFYDPNTDSLSIKFGNNPAVVGEEIAENVIASYDDKDNIVLVEFLGNTLEIFAPFLENK